MKKKLILFGLVLMTITVNALAQTAKILSVTPKGYVVEVEGNDMKQTYLSVKVKLQYSRIADDDAGCAVVLNTAPFAQITNMDQLYQASLKYDVGSEDLEGSVQLRTTDMDIYVPIDAKRVSTKASVLYLQAVVLQGEEAQNIIAKSQVMKVGTKDLTVIDMFRSEEDINKFANIISGAVGLGLDAMGGDGDCPNCHGKGEVEEKASYGTYTRQCYYCDGTGRDPASSEKSADSESSGSILDLFFGSGSEASNNSKATKKTK